MIPLGIVASAASVAVGGGELLSPLITTSVDTDTYPNPITFTLPTIPQSGTLVLAVTMESSGIAGWTGTPITVGGVSVIEDLTAAWGKAGGGNTTLASAFYRADVVGGESPILSLPLRDNRMNIAMSAWLAATPISCRSAGSSYADDALTVSKGIASIAGDTIVAVGMAREGLTASPGAYVYQVSRVTHGVLTAAGAETLTATAATSSRIRVSGAAYYATP